MVIAHPLDPEIVAALAAELAQGAGPELRAVFAELLRTDAARLERHHFLNPDDNRARDAAIAAIEALAKAVEVWTEAEATPTPAALFRPLAGDEVWRHKKRGSTYRVAAEAELQCAAPIAEGATLVVYQSTLDGRIWARPADEFHDGRFEVVDAGEPAARLHSDAAREIARASGYAGEPCACESFNTRRNGTCLVCTDCGQSTGCS